MLLSPGREQEWLVDKASPFCAAQALMDPGMKGLFEAFQTD